MGMGHQLVLLGHEIPANLAVKLIKSDIESSTDIQDNLYAGLSQMHEYHDGQPKNNLKAQLRNAL